MAKQWNVNEFHLQSDSLHSSTALLAEQIFVVQLYPGVSDDQREAIATFLPIVTDPVPSPGYFSITKEGRDLQDRIVLTGLLLEMVCQQRFP